MLNHQDMRIYFWEIRSKVSNAARAWNDADQALAGVGSEDFWYSVDLFLGSSIAAANILWPSAKSKTVQARAQELRDALGLSQAAPTGLREVRNGFEHFDERIDDWRRNTKSSNFLDTIIGPVSGMPGVDPGDIARSYDPSTGILTVYGVSTSIPDVLAELSNVQRALPAR